jgi:predicted Zn-dependent protease
MGRRIAARSSRPGLKWQFKVLETKEVNALSVPGYVYVNRGLIDFVGSDNHALASVIAHEVAHTAAKHARKAAEKQLTYSLAIQLLSKKGDARKLGGIAANLALLGYSRGDENEADRLGVRYMTAAGYDPNGMLRFFRKLKAREGKDPGGLTAYFRSHPPTSDRIGRVEKEIKAMGMTPQASAPVEPTRSSGSQDLIWGYSAPHLLPPQIIACRPGVKRIGDDEA